MKMGRRSKGEGRMTMSRSLCLMVICFALSAVAQEELPKLQPPLGEIPPTFWEQHGTTVMVSVSVAILLLALVVWLLLRGKPPVVLPPEVQARTALEALLQMPEDGKVISRASQILRRYVQTVFQLPAGEPTTTEFCQLMAGHSDIDEELAKALADFLHQSDERKFKSVSLPAFGVVSRALRLVEQAEVRRKQRSAEGGLAVV